MSFEFNLPNFQVETPSEQRLYAYLYQTVQQLNWALRHISTAPGSALPAGQAPAGSAGTGTGERSPMESFSRIKDLIIKSADIVEAYYDTIEAKLRGSYVARSEFGTYTEATALDLEANAEAITQNYTALQLLQLEDQGLSDRITGLQTNVTGVQADADTARTQAAALRGEVETLRQQLTEVRSTLVETRAYIKTGVVDTDAYGIPVYGLEIGQANEVNGREVFNKYARFSSSRLSFYDQNDTEVAYISDFKLYITNVEITGNLTVGDYELDTADGLAFRYREGG